MHEATMMRGAVNTVLEHMQRIGGKRVTGVDMQVGVSEHINEDVVRQYYALFAAGTPAEHASLRLSWLPATYQCMTCLHRFRRLTPGRAVDCPMCGGAALEVEHEDACVVGGIDIVLDEGVDLAPSEEC